MRACMQTCRHAELQACRHAEMQRCRHADMKICRHMQKCRTVGMGGKTTAPLLQVAINKLQSNSL